MSEGGGPPVGDGELDERLAKLPAPLARVTASMMNRWPGRFVLRSTAAIVRVELVDRAMTIAAQFFTSIFPILIMLASWIGTRYADDVANSIEMPEESRALLTEALDEPATGAFGVVGTLVVIIAATSLSRALTRAFAVVWGVARPRLGVTVVWRWIAAALVLALSLVVIRAVGRLAEGVPPRGFWQVVGTLVMDSAVAVLVPWLLLSGVVRARLLVPGGLVFGLIMLMVRPASRVLLPAAIDSSADRYGSIGVAFTYIAWLYLVSFIFLGAAVIGQVLASDDSRLGRFIRGEPSGAGSQPVVRSDGPAGEGASPGSSPA